jgi:hypothetical protein
VENIIGYNKNFFETHKYYLSKFDITWSPWAHKSPLLGLYSFRPKISNLVLSWYEMHFNGTIHPYRKKLETLILEQKSFINKGFPPSLNIYYPEIVENIDPGWCVRGDPVPAAAAHVRTWSRFESDGSAKGILPFRPAGRPIRSTWQNHFVIHRAMIWSNLQNYTSIKSTAWRSNNTIPNVQY